MRRWGALVILIKGLTPIPFKLVTIVSGLLGYNFAAVRRAVGHDARRAVLPARGRAQSFRRSACGWRWSVISPPFLGFSRPLVVVGFVIAAQVF